MIKRSVSNLLRNAREHGGGVRELLVDQDDGRLRFRVFDRGDAIVTAEAFEAFHTASGSLGLGLFLVKRVALAHGGDVCTDVGCVGFTVGRVPGAGG